MGLSSSEVSFLALTARKSDISYMLSSLSNQKMRLANQSADIATEYQQALSSKILKYSSNNGATYTDITYSSLMSPSIMNQYDPYIITDRNDKVVVDNKYKQYAEMISANGQGGKDWFNNSNRTAILSSLTGINKSEFTKYSAYDLDYRQKEAALQDIEAHEPPEPTGYGIWNGKDGLLDHAAESYPSSYRGNNKSFADFYDSGKSILLLGELEAEYFHEYANGADKDPTGLKSNYQTLAQDYLESISNTAIGRGYGDETPETLFSGLVMNLKNQLQEYFPETGTYTFNDGQNDLTYTNAWEAACQQYLANHQVTDATIWASGTSGADSGTAAIGFDISTGILTVNVRALVGEIIGYYEGLTGKYTGVDDIEWHPTDTDDYAEWQDDHNEWQDEYDEAKEAYDDAYERLNSVFTSEQLKEIDFYDSLFSTIAEKGWNYNENINNSDYLNQVLQNNIYSLTRVRINEDYDTTSGYSYDSTYETDVASNCSNIVSMNDTDNSEIILADYTAKKQQIQAKETRIDTRMTNLETELNSITSRLTSLEQIMSDNTNRYFKIFTS